MENTEIKHCGNCEHNNIINDYQDNKYGKFNRVFNVSEKTGNKKCSVCGTIRK